MHFWDQCSSKNLTWTGECRRLHNEEFWDLHYSGDQIMKNEMGGVCATMKGGRAVYRVLAGKPEWKRQLGRRRFRWDDNIKMTLQWVGWGIDWIDLVQIRDRWLALVTAVKNFRFPKKRNSLISWEPVTFSERTLFSVV